MKLLQRLFHRQPWTDLGLAKFRVISSSDVEDVVSLKGIAKNMEGAIRARMVEQAYIAAHPCKCGGEWVLQRSSSAYPVAHQYHRCATCGSEKGFIFGFLQK